MKNIEIQKSTVIFVICFFLNSLILAQGDKEKIIYPEDSFDFGTIQEINGEVQHDFYAVNLSADTLFLKSVMASCGCTTPYWAKEAILPNDSAKIVVAYNPLNRPGSFDKTISVQTNLTTDLKILSITGYVEPKVLMLEDKFPMVIGGLRFKSKFLNFGTITTEKPVTKTFEFFNQSSDTISFLSKNISGDFMDLSILPATIFPKRAAELTITYDPQKRNDLGFLNDPIVLFTNEEKASNKSLNVIATILEYFPPMTEKELAKAPKLNFDEASFDFDVVNEGDSLTHAFSIKNDGKKTLNIRQVKSSCDCLKASIVDEDIKSGKSTTLNVTFNTQERRGPQVKRISLFTNDPTAPVQDFIIKAYVRENE